ncbi:protein SSUH2 homolog [Erinaceus europaeus]|uniref:Protein SSUH2 homolog n=1 Tax=Erinaceus europaeus TaxID=9365 RepID=A0A1S3WA90_ERIEU|nr:protein SSUH2 homolog [Erinaceus europaeus]
MDREGSQDQRWQAFSPMSEPSGRHQELRGWSWFLEHRVPVVTEEVAQDALLSFLSTRCCSSRVAAGGLVIRELRSWTLCRYRLQTFSESRTSEGTFQPLTRLSVDGPQRGASPRLWDITVPVPPMFQEDTRRVQVPHSSHVKECHKCRGHGRVKCSSCHGAGMMSCPCHSGAKHRAQRPRRCPACSGSGRHRCSTCSGRGSRQCATCRGEKRLRHFTQMVVTWKNSLFESLSQHALDCPPELLARARGHSLLQEEGTQVSPLEAFPLPEISRASEHGTAEHSAALGPGARILRQRQTVELVPVTEVHCWLRGRPRVFLICGTDLRVHLANVPGRCTCSVL